MVMAVSHAAQELVEEALQNVRLQTSLADVQVLLQVLIQVLEHQCQLPLRVNHVVQPENVSGVIELTGHTRTTKIRNRHKKEGRHRHGKKAMDIVKVAV